jgi:putative transcriptional regulator
VKLLDLLPDYVLGLLEPEQMEVIAAHIAEDPALAAEERALRETMAAMARALTPVPPPPRVRDRVLASVLDTPQAARAAGRFDRFAARFASIFDVAVERARELLSWVDDPARWDPPLYPGVRLIHFTGGPACAGCDTGFVRMEPGAVFPHHAHDGEEVTLVLQGGARDSHGTVLTAGLENVLAPGAAHELVADRDSAYIYAVRVAGLRLDVPKPA